MGATDGGRDRPGLLMPAPGPRAWRDLAWLLPATAGLGLLLALAGDRFDIPSAGSGAWLAAAWLGTLVFALRRVAELRAESRLRARAEALLERASQHDGVTGLPNWRILREEFAPRLAAARAEGRTLALLLIDLDRFGRVNELHGHGGGDAALSEIALRLQRALAPGDLAARKASDEFVVLAGCDAGQEAPRQLALRLRAALQRPLSVAPGLPALSVGGSLGGAVAPADAEGLDELMRRAEAALSRAKQGRHGAIRFFDTALDGALVEEGTLRAELRDALERGEIVPYFQPLVALPSGRITGFELLARWRHPERGLLGPATFLQGMKEMGLAAELTGSVLRQAAQAARDWPSAPALALNVSPPELQDRSLPWRIAAILNACGFPPARLEVEVTETALVQDLAGARDSLAALRALGVRAALDDFGTGYSGLLHLRELRVDKIKLDASFIRALAVDDGKEAAEIIAATLGLARALGIRANAEGIETAEVAARLAELGCEEGQGFWFGRPMDARAAEAFLAEHHRQQEAVA
jgi:diguanylate cyclase (GGDEF)-like protein